jgi:hypothetical protein
MFVVSLAVGVSVYAAPPGLQVQNGVLTKDGQPYRGIGANYFSLFSRVIENPTDKSSLSNLAALGRARIPFVRFSCGFGRQEWHLYLTNRVAYFQRLDMVVRCAETNNVGLIPSLFWQPTAVPEVVGEHLDELGNRQSKTIAFIRRYIEEVVTRYKESPAIWGWEFGNEYNNFCDLPNAARGTELKSAQVRVAFTAFAETVRQFDRRRIIISGNSMPRAEAWHDEQKQAGTVDTAAQFGEMLLRDNPHPMDTICIHLYPRKKEWGGYPGGVPFNDIGKAMALANSFAKRAGKPLVIGEFGVEREDVPREHQQALFAEFLDALARERVPLAAFWVFDWVPEDKVWNVSFDNDRAWMLDAVVHANAQLQKEQK